jgi:ribosomal protein S18 acetylase RimI-like enzyme
MVTLVGRLVPPQGKEKIYILGLELPPGTEGDEGTGIEPLGVEELSELAGQYPVLSGRIQNRQEIGDLCFGERMDGQLVHYTWVALVTHSFHGTAMNFNEDEAYIYDVYTRPEYRKRGIASKMTHTVLDYLCGLGKNRVYVGIYDGNDASLALFEGLGFDIIGEVATAKVLDGRQLRSLIDESKFVPSVIGLRGYTPELDIRLRRIFQIRPR